MPDLNAREDLSKVKRVPSMKDSTNKTDQAEAAVVAEIDVMTAKEMHLPRTSLRRRSRKNQLKRPRRSLNLNTRRLFLVSISMISSVTKRLLATRRRPEVLRRSPLHPRRTKNQRNIKKLLLPTPI
jgi:hypothetical protein